MHIRFTKSARPDKPHVITMMRGDGTVTGQHSREFFIVHDLAHYAVETTLGYDNAFCGLVAGGMSIDDFNVAGGAQALNLPPVAGQVEFIVGLLQIELANGRPYDDFAAELCKAAAGARGEAFDPPTDDQIVAIRRRFNELLAEWSRTPPGGHLELEFPMSAAQENAA